MDVRAQLAMVLNLDKCLGCHTCSIACKNVWTDRRGAEYMWWNNVETKPGLGYPKKWEDQGLFKGGWVKKGGKLRLRALGKGATLLNMFFQPNMPKIEDYYEPFDFDYARLHGAGEEDDQPVAEAFSQISGRRMSIQSGPNWDDDLSGSQIYAANDVNLAQSGIVEDYARMFMQWAPRTCNHCLNPACVASCPSRAMYKRGEDGTVLVDQNTCRGWRFCTSACPYKKVYFNWSTGKAEKCISCYPRTETGQSNVCVHTCVGRIRYVGVLLYDAEKVEQALLEPDDRLVQAQRAVLLDPKEKAVIEGARKNGISDQWLDAAVRSPAYALIKEFELALPLHPEFRTMPMLYYIPALSPVLGSDGALHETMEHGMFPEAEGLRAPLAYLASLFAAGNREIVSEVLRKLTALRVFMRAKNLEQPGDPEVLRRVALDEAGALRIQRLFTTAGYDERSVIPSQQREEQVPHVRRGGGGFGILNKGNRW
jgi:nitrate reductase beta subunit